MCHDRYFQIQYPSNPEFFWDFKRSGGLLSGVEAFVGFDGVFCPLKTGAAQLLNSAYPFGVDRVASQTIEYIRRCRSTVCLRDSGMSARLAPSWFHGWFQAVHLIKAMEWMLLTHPNNQTLKVFLAFHGRPW